MQATANQVCWVPIKDIVVDAQGGGEPSGAEGESATVLLAARDDGRYTLLGGRERLRRLREQGLNCVDAVLSPTERMEQRVSCLLDKLVKNRIHYLDEAEEYRCLLGGGMSAQELATRIGRTVATVRKKLRLLNLGEEICVLLRENNLNECYAHELLRVPGIQGRIRVLQHTIHEGLSLKEMEKLIDDVLSHMPIPMTGGRKMRPMMRDYRLYLNAIRGIVEQMRDAGLDADIQVAAGRRVVDVRVTVPIFSQRSKGE